MSTSSAIPPAGAPGRGRARLTTSKPFSKRLPATAWRWRSTATRLEWTSRRRWRDWRWNAAATFRWTPMRTCLPSSLTYRWRRGWRAGPASRRTESSTSWTWTSWPPRCADGRGQLTINGHGQDRNHDRGAGRPYLGALAPHLQRCRQPWIRLVAAQRAFLFGDGRGRSRLHRMLDVARPRGGVDQDDRVRHDGEPDDVPTAGTAGEDGGGGRRPFRGTAHPRRRCGLV